jgi:multiple sugar transport system substrate-binding protein
MKNKRLLSGILVLGILLSILTGCGTSSSNKPSSTTSGEKTVAEEKTVNTDSKTKPYELSVSWWGGEARHEKTLKMIDAYMQKYPNAKIVSQYAAYTDYWTKLATQAASSNLPDVYLVQLTYLGEYASKGLMRPLQDLVDAGKIDVSKFTPGALSSSSYDGKLVGITFGDTASVLAYNKTLIESVGYPLPKDQMTYSEMADYLKGLAKVLPSGTYASGLTERAEYAIENFARNYGMYGVTSKDGKTLGYTKEVLAKYLSYYYDLYKAGVNGPMEVIQEDRPKQFADSLAGNGKIAVWGTNANQLKIFQASVEDDLDMVRFPVADDATNKNIEAAVCSTWAISGTSKKVDEAAQFINEMVNNWELQEVYDMDIGVPGSTEIQNNLIEKLDLSKKVDVAKKKEITMMQDILKSIEPFNGRPSGYGAIVDDLYKKIDEVLYETMTVDEAVDAHFKAAETLLK